MSGGIHQEEVLVDLAWSFIGGKFSSLEQFNDAVRQYQIDIEEDDAWYPNVVVINFPQVKVLHDRWETDEEEAMAEVILTADNGQYFTAGELLFKTHNAFVSQLADMDHHFFEGFCLLESDEEIILPIYEVSLGS